MKYKREKSYSNVKSYDFSDFKDRENCENLI